MATFRYTCACTRYLSPTRVGAVHPARRHRELGPYPAHTHSAPSSPSRWRSTTTNSATSFGNVPANETNPQQVVTATSEEAIHNETNTLTKRNSFLLKIDSLAEGFKDVREWTAVNAPKMDTNTVGKLISSLNIDLPKYQQFLTRKARAITGSPDEEIEGVRQTQQDEERTRLFKNLDIGDGTRETHDYGEAMKNAQDSIHTYYSAMNFPTSQPACASGVLQRVTDDSGKEKVTQGSIITQVLSKTDSDKSVTTQNRVLDHQAVARAAIDKRTRGLVCALKMTTTDASRLHRLEDLCLHLTQYTKFAKNVAIQERVIPHLLKLRKSKDTSIAEHSLQALHLVGYVQPVRGRGVRILSIDGGGTRGLVALEMLRQIEIATQKPIHEMFDYICGVSTGALIAVMIGAFRRPLDECERLYKEFSREMFGQNRFQGVSKLVTTHAYYDTQLWEKILQENIGLDKFTETMKDEKCPKLCVVSSLVNQKNMENFLFRNYTHATGVQSKYRGSIQHRLWEAIRASSAAPGYYEEFKTGQLIHQDGGLMTNNPGAIAIHECKLLWPNEKLQCIISVGTGRYRPMEGPAPSYNLKDKILKVVQSATDTEAVHTILHDLLPPSTYFRFNPYLSDEFLLDEIAEERWELMNQDALMYCRKNEVKLTMAAAQLNQAKMGHQRAAEWVRAASERLG